MKKFVSWLLVAVLALGMCSWVSAEETAVDVIDFEDGAFGFLGLWKGKANADASTLEVAEFNGSKALKITLSPDAKVPYVAFNIEGLLGERLADVAAVSVDFGLDMGSDGKFHAVSGKFYDFTGEDNAEASADWSVYLQKKNPRTIVHKFAGAFLLEAGNFFAISREDQAGGEPVAIYLDNIKFLDADGNAIALDLSAEYVAPDSGRDLSNLVALTNVVEFPSFKTSAGAWSQSGFEMPQDFIDALVPGSVIEVAFESEDNNIWLVFPWAAAGWSRVAQNEALIIGDKAYITYEQIVAVCGEDKATWNVKLEAEGSSPWTVYSVRVGQKAEFYGLTNLVEFPGFATSAGAWSQSGFEMPQEFIDALVPGSVITVSYESEDGNIWIVLPWAEAGWSRVGNDGKDVADGHVAQITYEQIVEICGEDKATWNVKLECEGSSPWTVYSVAVGTAM